MPRTDRLETARRTAITRMGAPLVTGLLGTVRQELVHGADVERSILAAGVPAIYVLWHGRLLLCAYRYRHRGLGTLITRNRDGDYITGMIQGWGYHVVRGSSSRGGATALRSIVRLLRDGVSVAVTPDGPRGPRQKMKPGPLQAARVAQVPIVPVTAGARDAWHFGSWDRFVVPKPFTYVPVAFGEPLRIDATASDTELESCAGEVEARLNGITELVDEAAAAGAARR